MVIHEVLVRNRDGAAEPDNSSTDTVFNVKANVTASVSPIGMFIQDDYNSDGLDQELSRCSFVVYEKDKFDAVDTGSRYDDYLVNVDVVYINSYTGKIIE